MRDRAFVVSRLGKIMVGIDECGAAALCSAAGTLANPLTQDDRHAALDSALGHRPGTSAQNGNLSALVFRAPLAAHPAALFPLLLLLLSLRSTPGFALDTSWSIQSPDANCKLQVSLDNDGRLTYQVWHLDREAILNAPLGLIREDQSFDRGLSLIKAGQPNASREQYELFTGPKSRVDNILNRRTVAFRNAAGARIELDLAASNEGVAFRYRFPENSSKTHVLAKELTGFTVPKTATAWLQPYHAAGPYTPAYEDFYFEVSPGDLPPKSRAPAIGWGFPALIRLPKVPTWLLITESGTGPSYCGCHLAADSSNGTYTIAFPAADEFTKGQTNQLSGAPRYTLPWEMPWRVIVLGRSAADIALSTLVTDLAPASRIKDTAWIKPGRASWAWWSYPDGPNSTNIFNQFTDFAAEMGWEYTLFDAGWWQPGLPVLSDYAASRKVSPLAWCFAGDFYTESRRKKKLDEMQASGVVGVKVDFWCSDRQEAIRAMHDLFSDAAARKMVVNLHGCTLPRGWQRTWPNFLAAEAVLGTECYFFEPHYTERAAELNTILPFTRNVAGPMDSTPVACSPKKYRRTTTAAHELATAIVFSSGLVHYADKPEFFRTLPREALTVLREAPARWDETRFLEANPGHLVVVARRSGQTWFIAGLNGDSHSVELSMNVAELGKFSSAVLLDEEPADSQMRVRAAGISGYAPRKHIIPARGGFIARLSP